MVRVRPAYLGGSSGEQCCAVVLRLAGVAIGFCVPKIDNTDFRDLLDTWTNTRPTSFAERKLKIHPRWGMRIYGCKRTIAFRKGTSRLGDTGNDQGEGAARRDSGAGDNGRTRACWLRARRRRRQPAPDWCLRRHTAGPRRTTRSTGLVLDSAGAENRDQQQGHRLGKLHRRPGDRLVPACLRGQRGQRGDVDVRPERASSRTCAPPIPATTSSCCAPCNGSNFQRWIATPVSRHGRVPDLDQSRHPQDPAVRGQGRTADHRSPGPPTPAPSEQWRFVD